MRSKYNGFVAERSSIEKGSQEVKKVGYFLLGSGIAAILFLPGIGSALILGGAVVTIPAEIANRWAKNRK